MKKIQRKYGWFRDHLDIRDIRYLSARHLQPLMYTMPAYVDLRMSCPPVYDQGRLGSCTANAIVAAYEFDTLKQKCVYAPLSRLFLYFNERLMEGTTESDAGALIRDGIKSIADKGICEEGFWPYDEALFKTTPPPAAYELALNHQAISYYSVLPTTRDLQIALADGYPVVFGFTVYECFESEETAKTGIVRLPINGETTLGGHAVLLVGYDSIKRMFLVRNSWGTEWGDKGYFWMPYGYMDLMSDFWVVKTVE